MGIFSKLFSNSGTADSLPDDPEKLHKLYRKTSDQKVIFQILEKLHDMNQLHSDEKEWLIQLYSRNPQQNTKKLRNLLYEPLKKSGYTSLSNLSQIIHTVEPDYDLLIYNIAEYIAIAPNSSYRREDCIKSAAVNFHLLRDLIHLCELGLRDAKTREQELAFYKNHYNDDRTVRFYYHRLSQRTYSSKDEERDQFRSIMNEDSLVAINELDYVWLEPVHSSSESLSKFQNEAGKRLKYRKSCFKKYESEFTAQTALWNDYNEHYLQMSARELLDYLYANEAKELEARRKKEEERKAEEERIYQQRLRTISGRIFLAQQCSAKENYQDAEEHLREALLIHPDSEDDYEYTVAVYGEFAMLYWYQNDMERAMQCAVSFFDLYHTVFPQDTAWNKYRPGVLKLHAEDLYFTYDHYKYGPRHDKNHKANGLLSMVSRIFGKAYCIALRKRIADKENPLASALDLALHLAENYPEERDDAKFWLNWCITQGYVPALYLGATECRNLLGLTDAQAGQYLKFVAESNDKDYAGRARDSLEVMRMEAADAARVRRMISEYQQAQLQKEINARLEQYRKKLDSIERSLNFSLSGDISTIEQKITREELSFKQMLDYRELRWRLEHRAEQKIIRDLSSGNE